MDDALAKGGFRVVVLDQDFAAKWKQAQSDAETVALADVWLNDGKYADNKGVSLTTKAVVALGKVEHLIKYEDALKRQRTWKRDMNRVFGRVDFIALPTPSNADTQDPDLGQNRLV